jgi:hypothetical protein
MIYHLLNKPVYSSFIDGNCTFKVNKTEVNEGQYYFRFIIDCNLL